MGQSFGFGYGNVWQPPQPDKGAQGGILSAQQPAWSGDIGILGAALKDAGASLSGHPADAISLQEFAAQLNQRQMRQQLMQGLMSNDPAQRQQAYAVAPMFGVDPKPFQQQEANKATPALLDSMQNGQSLRVPQVTGSLPGLGQIQGGGFNMQTAPLSMKDALSNAPPELQQAYLPKLLDTQIAADAEAAKPFDLSPGQHRFIGGQDVAHLPDKPITREYQNGGNKITEQSLDGGQTWSQLGKGPAWKPDDETPPDPSTVQYWAQSVAAGQPLPALGMGKQAAQYRQAILKGAAAINSGQGLTGVDQNVNIASTKANSGALGKQTALRSATEGFENTMLQNMNVARDLLKKGAGTTGIPVLNRYQQYIKGQYAGDPDVVALKNAIDTVADENAKIRSGTLGNTPATDAMRTSIHEGLNTSQTPEQILSAFGVMEKDAGNRSRALRAQEAALKRGLTGKNDLPQIPGIREPQAQGGLPAPVASLPRLPAAQKIRVFNPVTGRLE